MKQLPGQGRRRRVKCYCFATLACFFAVWLSLLRFLRQSSDVHSVLSVRSSEAIAEETKQAVTSEPESSTVFAREIPKSPSQKSPNAQLVTWSSPPSFRDIPGGESPFGEVPGTTELSQVGQGTIDKVRVSRVVTPTFQTLGGTKDSSRRSQRGGATSSREHVLKSKTISFSSNQQDHRLAELSRTGPPTTRQQSQPPEPALTAPASDSSTTRLNPDPAADPDPNPAAGAGADADADADKVDVYREAGLAPSRLLDFPCPLSSSPVSSKYATMCKVQCPVLAAGLQNASLSSSSCGVDLCKRLVECHAVVPSSTDLGPPGGLPPPHGNTANTGNTADAAAAATASAPPGSAMVVVVLKSDPHRLRDDSMDRIKASKWWGKPELSTKPRPRLYVVASYGGSGSKMLGGFLQGLPAKYRTNIWHVHDRFPPRTLRALTAKGELFGGVKAPEPQYVNVKQKPKSKTRSVWEERHRVGAKKRNSRDINFGGDTRFRNDTDPVRGAPAIGDHRVIFIFKDPSEALVSRYSHEHCVNVQGDCGRDAAQFPNLTAYAFEGVDRMRLAEHFAAYTGLAQVVTSSSSSSSSTGTISSDSKRNGLGGPFRNYPVVCLNYHKLWSNLPAVMLALGLPESLASSFPRRKEKVRTLGADRHGGGGGSDASEETRSALRAMYRPLGDAIAALPAVVVV